MKKLNFFIVGIGIGLLFTQYDKAINNESFASRNVELELNSLVKQANLALDEAEKKYIKLSPQQCECNGAKVIVQGDGHKTPCLCNPCNCKKKSEPSPPISPTVEDQKEVETIKQELEKARDDNKSLKSQIDQLNSRDVSITDLLSKIAKTEDLLRISNKEKSYLDRKLQLINTGIPKNEIENILKSNEDKTDETFKQELQKIKEKKING